MGRTVMSSNTVQLKGLDMWVYFIEHFKMTPEEALQEMKDHDQDTTAVEKAIAMANKQDKAIVWNEKIDKINKQKGK